jgi:hypothetical protein
MRGRNVRSLHQVLVDGTVPEPTEAELAAVFKALDAGRRTRPITAQDEARIQEEIRKYRDKQRRRKA